MDFATKTTIKSTACPGVSYTIRILTLKQRYAVDAGVSEARDKVRRISFALDESAEGLSVDARVERRRMTEEMEQAVACDILPHIIKSGLIAFDGLTISGQCPTIDELIADGPDDLLNEIGAAIQQGGAMSEDETKNSASPTTLLAVVGGAANNTSAEPAGETAGGANAPAA